MRAIEIDMRAFYAGSEKFTAEATSYGMFSFELFQN